MEKYTIEAKGKEELNKELDFFLKEIKPVSIISQSQSQFKSKITLVIFYKGGKAKTKSDIKNSYKNTLLSELSSEDFEDPYYFEVTLSFYKLFINNAESLGVSSNSLKKAKGNWIDEIRLLKESDGYKEADFNSVFGYLKNEVPSDGFSWKATLQSTKGLRKNFNLLIMRSKTNGKTKQLAPKTTDTQLAKTIAKNFADKENG